ncbi:hypothetical protein DOM22_07820 [Bdellovibrio sp. ZAP7]|uniref:hypothetical protein n=1 Tax=Bdellovibrio sp. ZAP7 TaxID=2231053 RepID=UPI00115B30A7|nr:hypothetical protein [Bdellovibrio sp. ZAP7]QDK45071.1 hypothetical protein DOM22_07820 [Bdellovibrio sp. ZAP7]
MKQVIAAIVMVFSVPTISMATAMSPERSRCWSMEASLDSYKAWSKSYSKFKAEELNLDETTRFYLKQKALSKVVMLTEDFAKQAQVKAPVNLITQAKDLIKETKAGHIPQASAVKIMTSGLERFEEKMGEMINRAETDNQECFMKERVIYTEKDSAVKSSKAVN